MYVQGFTLGINQLFMSCYQWKYTEKDNKIPDRTLFNWVSWNQKQTNYLPIGLPHKSQTKKHKTKTIVIV